MISFTTNRDWTRNIVNPYPYNTSSTISVNSYNTDYVTVTGVTGSTSNSTCWITSTPGSAYTDGWHWNLFDDYERWNKPQYYIDKFDKEECNVTEEELLSILSGEDCYGATK